MLKEGRAKKKKKKEREKTHRTLNWQVLSAVGSILSLIDRIQIARRQLVNGYALH